MESGHFEKIGNSLAVCVFADYTTMTAKLVSTLINKGMTVYILSDDVSWETAGKVSEKLIVVDKEKYKNILCGYLVYINLCETGSDKDSKNYSDDNVKVLSILNKNLPRCVLVTPQIVSTNVKKEQKKLLKNIINLDEVNASFLFVGETLKGSQDKSILGKMISGAVNNQLLRIPKALKEIAFANEDDVLNLVVKSLFDFSMKKTRFLKIGENVFIDNFIQTLKKNIEDIKVEFTNEKTVKKRTGKEMSTSVDWEVMVEDFIKTNKKLYNLAKSNKHQSEPEATQNTRKKNVKFFILNISYLDFIKAFVKKLKRNISLNESKIKDRRKLGKGKHNIKISRKTKIYICLFIFFLTSPYILLALSMGELYYSLHLIKQLDTTTATRHILNARKYSNLSKNEIEYFASIPGGKQIFAGSYNTAKIINDTSELAIRGVNALELSLELKDKFFDETSYDVSFYSDKLNEILNDMYSKSGFLLTDIKDNRFMNKTLLIMGVNVNDLTVLRDKFRQATQLIEQLPELLGETGERQYLFLFQNNMELRPAGGFIGSFAVMKVNSGHMTDFRVYDVYDADGQLKGYVEPPQPIAQYLNSSGWYLRDSNWDPDFEWSARSAEWFLEKEMNIKVDGVVGIDLNALGRLIKNFNEVYLTDYGVKVDSSNFYQIIQNEIEDNFFPGSKTKATILSSLSREIMSSFSEGTATLSLNIPIDILDSLDERNIQIYLHNPNAQKAIAILGWSGAMQDIKCLGNCFNDFTALVEANLGVNKVNYFIRRQIDFNVQIDKDNVHRIMDITLENTAEDKGGGYPWYKSYIRVFAPKDVQFSPVSVTIGDDKKILEPTINKAHNLTDAGVFVELDPKQKATIRFSWESLNNFDLQKDGQYLIHVRKQAGTDEDPLNVSVEIDHEDASLTNGGRFLYNINLKRDFVSHVYW